MTVDMKSIGVQSRINMFGCNDARYFWLTAGGVAWAWGIGGGYGGGYNLSQYANTRFNITLNVRALTVIVNGEAMGATVGSYSKNLPDANVYLFDCNGFAGRTPFVGMIYGCTIEEGGVLVRDFQPVRFTNENGQSEGAMYDKVTKQLFRNKGTGRFAIGPDIKSSTRMLIDVTTSLNPTDKYWIYPEISSTTLDT